MPSSTQTCCSTFGMRMLSKATLRRAGNSTSTISMDEPVLGGETFAAQVAGCRIPPGRLRLAPRERASQALPRLGKQRRQRDAEPAADLVHQLGGGARFPALDARQHRAADVGALGKPVERQSLLAAQIADARADPLVDVGRGRSHISIIRSNILESRAAKFRPAKRAANASCNRRPRRQIRCQRRRPWQTNMSMY